MSNDTYVRLLCKKMTGRLPQADQEFRDENAD